MSLIIHLDGEYVTEENAKVSVFDHGFLYGDGIFEGIRAYNGRVFRLDEHLERLYDSAKAVYMTIPISIEQMEEVVLETLRRNQLRDAYIRLIVSRGKGDLGLDPRKCPKPLVLCIASAINLYPEDFYLNGMEVVTVATRRNIPEALNPRIKSLNYLNNFLAKIEAFKAGVLEAVMLNQEGYVAECTGDNIFIVKKGKLITPPTHVGLLEGITRNCVMDIARQSGIDVSETVFTRYDLYIADEVFLTGTAAEVIPVVKIDSRTIGEGVPGPITKNLITQFHQVTQSEGTEIN